jgi:uncharacterized repeat protein (TIGR03803 family)
MKSKLLLTALLLTGTGAFAQYTVLHTFYNSGTLDGAGVAGPLTGDEAGTLYGMTTSGGLQNRGVIFSLRTNGTDYTVLHDFDTIASDGFDPRNNSLTLADGILYGATVSSRSNGNGVVFSIATNGANYQILHYFVNTGSDGRLPFGTLLVTGSSLIGVTRSGSFSPLNGLSGTIYKMDTNGLNYEIIHRFDGLSAAGGNTAGGLLLLNSTLYGQTHYGTTGAVYSVGTDGSNFQVLTTYFDRFSSTERPLQLTTDGTKLYGLTRDDFQPSFGTVFSVSTNGANFQTLHNFPDVPVAAGGAKPSDTLSLDGTTIIGAAFGGGSNGGGTIFRLNTNGTGFENLFSFDELAGEGHTPYGGFVRLGSTYFGATSGGYTGPNPGATNYNGVIFAFTPSTNTGAAIDCTLTPALATNTVGDTHIVTATVTSNGLARSGAVVNFTVTGANAGNKGTATTSMGGAASFTYTGVFDGLDVIRAISLGATGTATKVWLPALPPDLSVEFDLVTGICSNTPKAVICPNTGSLTLLNNGVPYAAATFVINSTCKTDVVTPRCKLAGVLTLSQFDLTGLPDHALAFYLSDDATLDTGDRLLAVKPASKIARAMPKDRPVKLKLRVPKGTDLTGMFLIVVVDNFDKVFETDETNNTAASPPIAVVANAIE